MLFDLSYNYWIYFGTLNLIILAIQDLRKMEIDTRKNYIMLGLSISILSHVKHSIIFILMIVCLSMLWQYILRKYNAVAEGDLNTLTWIYLGFAFIGISSLIWFFIILISLTIVYGFIKNKILKIKKPVPFVPIIFLSFVLTSLLLGLY